jgi:dimeric dUTPase (all-alpha-NTP-PPase superfamily)
LTFGLIFRIVLVFASMGHNISTCGKDGGVPIHSLSAPKLLPVTATSVDSTSDDPVKEDAKPECDVTQQVCTSMQCEPNAPEIEAKTALDQIFILCELGVASAVKFILSNHPQVGTIINTTQVCYIVDTRMELTPLQLASACGHVETIKCLLLCPDIMVNTADPLFSMTALHLAVQLGQILAVETLCKDPRMEINERNIEGKAVLHLAAEHHYVGIIETILRIRPNVDLRIKDFDGNNVIHIAALHPSVAVMKMLTSHASLVTLYCDYFDVGNLSNMSSKYKNKKRLFEVCDTLSFVPKVPYFILFLRAYKQL